MQKVQKKQRRGFTLIEVLIVVVILGILAATVLPQFTASTQNANESAVVQNLQLLRSQIQLYRFQHDGGLPTVALIQDQLTQQTDEDGTINNTDGAFGPYIVGQLPPNPFNSLRTVVQSTNDPITSAEADGTSSGWLYNETSGEIRINWDEALMNDDGTSQAVFDL